MSRNVWTEGYRLTTAEILYRTSDHPEVLQTFVWQDLDLAPQYPVLNRFIKYWRQEIEGDLHSITIGKTEMVTPEELRHANVSLLIH